jgi:hypothetical protein
MVYCTRFFGIDHLHRKEEKSQRKALLLNKDKIIGLLRRKKTFLSLKFIANFLPFEFQKSSLTD